MCLVTVGQPQSLNRLYSAPLLGASVGTKSTKYLQISENVFKVYGKRDETPAVAL